MNNLVSGFQLSKDEIEKMKKWEKGEGDREDVMSEGEDKAKIEVARRLQEQLQQQESTRSANRRLEQEKLVKSFHERDRQKRLQKAQRMCGVAGVACSGFLEGKINLNARALKIKRSEGSSAKG
jgi:archaellum component FlaD/FlaE